MTGGRARTAGAAQITRKNPSVATLRATVPDTPDRGATVSGAAKSA